MNLIDRYILCFNLKNSSFQMYKKKHSKQIAIKEIMNLSIIMGEASEKVEDIISSVLLDLFNYTLDIRGKHYNELKELINSGEVENIYSQLYDKNKWGMLCTCELAYLSVRIKYISESLSFFQKKVEAYSKDDDIEINYITIGSGNLFQDFLLLNSLVQWVKNETICKTINIFAVDPVYCGFIGNDLVESYADSMFERLEEVSGNVELRFIKYSKFDEIEIGSGSKVNLAQPTFYSMVDTSEADLEMEIKKYFEEFFKVFPVKAPFIYTTLLHNSIVYKNYLQAI